MNSEQFKRHTRRDSVLSQLLDVVLKGVGGDIPALKPFWTRLCELTLSSNSAKPAEEIVAPTARWPLWHGAHEGASQEFFWWTELDYRSRHGMSIVSSCPLHATTSPYSSMSLKHPGNAFLFILTF